MSTEDRRLAWTRSQFMRRGAGFAAGVSLLGLAACGSDDDEGGGGGGSTGTATGGEQGTPRKGGTIQIAIGDNSANETLDPALQNGISNAQIYCGAIFEPLVRYNDKWEILPALAESWEASDDAKEYTFKLRSGVKWHDGKPLTPQDVIFSVGRLLDEDRPTGLYARISPSLAKSGMSAVDDTTISFKLKRADSLFPLVLGAYQPLIVQDGTSDDFKDAIGTGPFRLKSFQAGRSWELERNDDYWNPDLPYLDGLRGVVITDPSTKLQSVLSGASQMSDRINASDISRVESNSSCKLIEMKDALHLVIAMDSEQKPFDDPRVAQAFNMAVDRKKLLEIVQRGRGSVTDNVPAPSSDPYYPDVPEMTQEIEGAKKLLAEAGHANGVDLELTTATVTGGLVDMAVAAKEQAAAAGFRIKIKQVPADSFWSQAWLKKPMYTSYWNKRHPAETLDLVYRSTAEYNEANFNSSELDSLLDKTFATVDPDERTEVVKEALTVSTKSTNMVPYFVSSYFAANKKVQGAKVDFAHVLLMDEAYLDA